MLFEVLIVEDEELLWQLLVEQLGWLWLELKLVVECEDGVSVLEQLVEKQLDIVFFDICMFGISGIEVVCLLFELSLCIQVVFVIVYDQYVIDVFEQGVMDYLLKLVSDECLLVICECILLWLLLMWQDDVVFECLLQWLGILQGVVECLLLVWIIVSNGCEMQLIMFEDVVYFCVDNKYIIVVIVVGESLLCMLLCELLEVFDVQYFCQIYCLIIVNMKVVVVVSCDDIGCGVLCLCGCMEMLVVSQLFMSLFRGMQLYCYCFCIEE